MWIDTINTQPQHNVALAFDIGLTVPEVRFLKALSESEREEVLASAKWTHHRSVGLIIQQLRGLDITQTFWWDGEKYRHNLLSIQDKNLLTGGQGVELESNLITLKYGYLDIANTQFSKLAKIIQSKDSSYRGFVSIDVLIKKGICYYNRIRFGVSYDFLYAMGKLYDLKADTLVSNLESNAPISPIHAFAGSIRVYAYPYEPEANMWLLEPSDSILKGDESYIITGYGKNIGKCWNNIYKTIGNLDNETICYRTDAHYRAAEVLGILKEKGHI